MEELLNWLRSTGTGPACVRLLLAALLGGLIGSERGRHGRAAGMRTHILVCLGAALTTVVGLYTIRVMGLDSDPLRVGAQVISGIGFLGAGTILIKDRFQVTGLTTAAGLWATAAIGLSIGIGFFEAALCAALLVLAANAFLPRVERDIKSRTVSVHIYVELNDPARGNELSAHAAGAYGVESFQPVAARSGEPGRLGVELELLPDQQQDEHEICRALMALEYVAFAVATQ